MNNRILNSKDIKNTVGVRLQKARKDTGYSREKFCEVLNKHEASPVLSCGAKALQPDTLKQWELGTNAINILWLPAVCKVLNCDTGYIFGEHEGKTGIISDVQKETGLSEKAIEELLKLNRLDSYYSRTIQELLSVMLTDSTFLPEMYRSFVEMWNMKQKSSNNSPVVDGEGGIYLFGNDAIGAIMFHVQKEIVRFLGEFFLSIE